MSVQHKELVVHWLYKQNAADRSGLPSVIYFKMCKHLNKYYSNEEVSQWYVHV
jgi:hypothetical protein